MPRDVSSPLPQPIFAEPIATPDPTQFVTPHPSDNAQYTAIQDLLTKDAVPFDPSRGAPSDLYSLSDALGPHGPELIQAIQTAGQIVFHSVGDTGSSDVRKYADEVKVSDALTADFHTSTGAERPSFFYHLGDVIYNFGEARYYYDQFYEPYRNYPAPVIAIPGNHDSFIIPGTAADQTPLSTFTRNFCATGPTVTAEAGSLHRTAMTQPGVYFTLDAPFVRIIGLFSNALEDPGLISSENGKWAGVPDIQLQYLAAQLERAKSQNYSGALLLATHHPAFTYAPAPGAGGKGGYHGGSPAMLAEIDTVCAQAGIYPHAFLSGHAHNYQRFTRTVQLLGTSYQAPFIVCGNGGHNVNPLVQAAKGKVPVEPANGTDVSYLDAKTAVPSSKLTLDGSDGQNYGYLRITASATDLQIDYHPLPKSAHAKRAKPIDSVKIKLSARTAH